MYLLQPESWTRRVVFSSRMLTKGGGVTSGSYTRRNKNVVVSPGLKARNEYTARVMQEKCELRDKCAPQAQPELAGEPVPGEPGKTYIKCTPDEAASRLQAARKCAIDALSTKGGVYGVS